MSHIKDRLSSYHDWMQDIANRYKLVTTRDFLEMIEQLQEDLEQDEKENGWIPVSERLPEIKREYEECYLVTDGRFCWMEYCKNKIDWTDVVAWRSLPEPYKEGRS